MAITPSFIEPWGATLTQNHPWTQAFPGQPISYGLSSGILHLFNPPVPKSGIRCILSHGAFPLLTSDGHNLLFQASSPSATITDSHDYIAYHLVCTKEIEVLHMELIAARGDAWGPWPKPDSIEGDNAFHDYGLNPVPFDVLGFFQWARMAMGKDPNPTGWDVFLVYIILEGDHYPTGLDIKNDYFTIYYGPGYGDPRFHPTVMAHTATLIPVPVTLFFATNYPCWATLHWSDQPPYKKPRWRFIRGVGFECIPSWTLVNPHIKMSEEVGDTLAHTFILKNWPMCETRWYYITCTVEGYNTWSESAIFHFHRPVEEYGPPITVTFYADHEQPIRAADGYVARRKDASFWSGIHDGQGTEAYSLSRSLMLHIQASYYTGLWYFLARTFLHFNTIAFPGGSKILWAQVRVKPYAHSKTVAWNPTFAVVDSHDPSPEIITIDDYLLQGSEPLSDILPWSSIIDNEYTTWTINPASFSKIISHGITKFALREMTYDAPNSPPPWGGGRWYRIDFRGRQEDLDLSPKLVVRYQPPG